MSHVVNESCIRCKYTDCVDVCPTDAVRAGGNLLVISPDDCIDCAVCIPECPVVAIFHEDDLPNDQRKYISINADHSAHWPMISRRQPAPDDADAWSQVADKAHLPDPRAARREGRAARCRST
ncbi:ferredoxin [Hydrogenophaga crassostreae]|uniref:Ferredoxin n=1 Tax=Hydrogenophaga crassostreae TaxID=1763535 RepID=A0A167GJN2_9BURK|nr:ferredoxin FdxA [Hydrogenophaga crassostreae]AOW15084.1 ferredoxin [Hydrogenophaga crassostreae]OAD39537.1 ferredoxin [Hydrogenophaga crassostreae]